MPTAEAASHVVRWEDPTPQDWPEHPILGELRANPNRWALVAEVYVVDAVDIEVTLENADDVEVCRRPINPSFTFRYGALTCNGWKLYARYTGEPDV